MKNFCNVLCVCLALALSANFAYADATNYTFDIDFVSVTADSANDGLLGYDSWYQWLYRVDVVEGGDYHNGLSHFTLEMLECYDEVLLGAIASTAGANGVNPNTGNLSGLIGDQYRTYNFEYGQDGSTGIWGVKWNDAEVYDKLDVIGEWDYFWFSAPTDQSVLEDALVKYSTQTYTELIESPDCPDCRETVPEPATMSLLGIGLFGLIGLRKRS